MKNGVTTYSEDVVASADAQALTKKSKFRLRVVTQSHAFMRGLDDACFCQELVGDTAQWFHHGSGCDVATHHRVDGGQGADFADFPVRGSIIQI